MNPWSFNLSVRKTSEKKPRWSSCFLGEISSMPSNFVVEMSMKVVSVLYKFMVYGNRLLVSFMKYGIVIWMNEEVKFKRCGYE